MRQLLEPQLCECFVVAEEGVDLIIACAMLDFLGCRSRVFLCTLSMRKESQRR